MMYGKFEFVLVLNSNQGLFLGDPFFFWIQKLTHDECIVGRKLEINISKISKILI